jgi:hypothetical protein
MSTSNAAAAAAGRAAILPYAGTIFLSAFLLFLVQPIIAKQIGSGMDDLPRVLPEHPAGRLCVR